MEPLKHEFGGVLKLNRPPLAIDDLSNAQEIAI
jgi:hypothetical protein